MVKAPTIEEFVKSVETGVKRATLSPTLNAETLLRLTVQVLIAEKRIEEELAKAKGSEREKLEEMMAKVKEMRDRVLRLYTALLLRGKPRHIPTPFEVKSWF